MRINNTKNKIIILGIVFIAALVFNIICFVDIKKSAMEVVELKKFVNQEMSQQDNLSSIKKDIETLQRARAEIDSILIQRDSVVSMIEMLESAALITETKLKISKIDISIVTDEDEDGDKKKENPKELYGELNIVLSVVGQWDGVNEYLDFIENIPHRISVDSIRLTEISNKDDVKWSMDLSITGITH